MTRFDGARREHFLSLFGAGRNVTEACAAASVSRTTVAKWCAKGRNGADREAREFAATFDAIREGRGDARLTADDTLRLLEKSARNGSVTAQKALLAELRRREEAANATHVPELDELDPFSQLPGDLLAESDPYLADEAAQRRLREQRS